MHQAKLKMDEQGAEAAAGSGAQTLPMEKPMSMTMNRPFLMMINTIKRNTTSVYFLGKLSDPSEK